MDEHTEQRGISEERCLAEALSTNIESALERLFAPIAETERLKRREYLSPEEVEALYGVKAVTLANWRIKAQGPEYIKYGGKILYKHQAVRNYLESRTVRTRD